MSNEEGKPVDPKQEIIAEVLAESATQKAMVEAPFLAIPILGSLFKMAVKKVTAMTFGELTRHVTFTWIDFKTEKEKRAYDKADANLKATQEMHEPREQEVNLARENFRNTLRELVRIRPHKPE